MSDSRDPAIWLQFARENLRVAEMANDSKLWNPCLQNAQQVVEKSIKSVFVSRGLPVRRTHNVQELKDHLFAHGIDMGITDDECDLIDSIYMPSKYPPESALPQTTPNTAIAEKCLEIARRACDVAGRLLPNP